MDSCSVAKDQPRVSIYIYFFEVLVKYQNKNSMKLKQKLHDIMSQIQIASCLEKAKREKRNFKLSPLILRKPKQKTIRVKSLIYETGWDFI